MERKRPLMIRCNRCALLVLILLCPVVIAAPFNAPAALRLSGNAGSEFKGAFELTPSEKTTNIVVFAGGLFTKSGTPISGAQVTVAAPGAGALAQAATTAALLPTFPLEPGPPLRLGVTVSGIPSGGEYEGALQLWQDKRLVHTIRLHLTATAAPKVTANTTATVIKLVDPDTKIGEWLTGILLRKGETLDTIDLEIVNTGGPAAIESGPELIADGTQTHYRLPSTAYKVSTQISRTPRGEIIKIPLQFFRDHIPPDQYAAAVNIRLRGVEATQVVPLSISLRADPLWPLIVLVVGLVIGRLIRWSEVEGERQAALLARLDRIDRRVGPADLMYIASALGAARRDVYDSQFTRADSAVATLESRADLLSQLDELDNGLDNTKATHQSILADVIAARTAVRIGNDTAAAQLTAKVSAAVGQLGVGPASAKIAKAAADAATAANRAVRASHPSRMRGARHWIAAVIGMALEARAETYRWIVRPLFYIFLLILLAYLGMQSLWVDNSTFGAGLVGDYVAILIWGMSTEVASKTLSSLKKP